MGDNDVEEVAGLGNESRVEGLRSEKDRNVGMKD